MENEILTVRQAAQYLGVSVSWVYQHPEELGAGRLGGRIFFSQEVIHERLFNRQRMEGGLHLREATNNQGAFQHQEKSPGVGRSKAKGTGGGEEEDTNRHGLLDPC